ncbi:hypothetical protein [Methylophilus sp. Q8]|uniref:hypothetical protein n=1 Tax=Methylophilus sp. Q8 TaxID=1506586 RepID=UPI000647DD5A|nr:hypothetical protein [Methylophilus sp. Q8]
MDNQLEDWPRQYYSEDVAPPFLFYVVFGSDTNELKLSRTRHRCDSIPQDIQISAYGTGSSPEVLDDFRQGYLWNELCKDQPALAQLISAQTKCVVIKGEIHDDSTLNYFRNTIGLLTGLLEADGVAVYDPQSFKWWEPGEWRSTVFEPAEALPREHVVILVSDESENKKWLHTRGMRKFGRPDLSVHGVSPDHMDGVIDLLNRFIEFQAFGGVIPEGQEVRMQSLPQGMKCTHGGNVEDPDFNNVHIEILWP